MDLIMRLESVILMLEQTRENVVVACDRAVCRVLLAYFEGLKELERLPYIDVKAGVYELRRSHSGFSSTHTPITAGAVTRAAGPGTLKMPPSPPVTRSTFLPSPPALRPGVGVARTHSA